jgi:hypothetical protein
MSIEIMLNIKLPTNLLLIPTVALLAACGGGGDTTIDPPSLSNSERAILLNDIFIDIEEEFIGDNIGPEDFTERADLPVEGLVQYSGAAYVAAGVYGPDDTEFVVSAYVGELELDAFFADGNISGEAKNFIVVQNAEEFVEIDAVPIAGGDVTGTLVIASIQDFDPLLAIYDVTVTGELIADDGSEFSLNELDAGLAVLGADADALVVFGDTDATVDGVDGYIEFGGLAKQ